MELVAYELGVAVYELELETYNFKWATHGLEDLLVMDKEEKVQAAYEGEKPQSAYGQSAYKEARVASVYGKSTYGEARVQSAYDKNGGSWHMTKRGGSWHTTNKNTHTEQSWNKSWKRGHHS